MNSKWFITLASRSTCVGSKPSALPTSRAALRPPGDDVGGHRRAVLAALLVDVLNDALTSVAARQIEIDVGPLAAFL